MQPLGDVYPGQPCTTTSQCLRDYYNCRRSECGSNGKCIQVNSPMGTSCSDLRNATNYDYCFYGICIGSYALSTFVQFSLDESAPASILTSYSYPVALQSKLLALLGLSNTSAASVLTCFDFTQRLASSFDGQPTQRVIRTCNVIACPSVFSTIACLPAPFIRVEFVSGPGAMDHAALAQQAAVLANTSALLAEFSIQSGFVSTGPDALLFPTSTTQTPTTTALTETTTTGSTTAPSGNCQTADINGDGLVNLEDLLEAISAWGPCDASRPTYPTDVWLCDGVTDLYDILVLTDQWTAVER